MNKESIIAIVLGLALGVGVAVGAVYITVKNQRQQNTQAQTTSVVSMSPTPTIVLPTVVVQSSLDVQKPSSGIIVDTSSVSIEGTAGTNTLVIVQSPLQSLTRKLNESSFKFDFPLALGENVIEISAYPEHASVPVQKRLYVYRII